MQKNYAVYPAKPEPKIRKTLSASSRRWIIAVCIVLAIAAITLGVLYGSRIITKEGEGMFSYFVLYISKNVQFDSLDKCLYPSFFVFLLK